MDASAKSLEDAYRDEVVALEAAEKDIRALANTIMQLTTRVERLHIARQEVARVTGRPEPVDALQRRSRSLLAQLSALGIIPTSREDVEDSLRNSCAQVGEDATDYGVGRREAPAAMATDGTLPDPERAEIPQDPLFDTEDVQTPQSDGRGTPTAHQSAWFALPSDGVFPSGGYTPEPGTIHGADKITGDMPVGTVVTTDETATAAIPAQAKAVQARKIDASLTDRTLQILEAASGPMTAFAITAELLGTPLGEQPTERDVDKTRKRLDRLKKQSKVLSPARGKWKAATAAPVPASPKRT